MRVNPQRLNLDANRQRWWHGPIDLIIQAEGEPEVIDAAHERAWTEFQTLLATLVTELPILSQAVQAGADNPFREIGRAHV